jgi:hypothetical protein
MIGNLISARNLLGNSREQQGHEFRRVLALVMRGEATGGPRLLGLPKINPKFASK